MTKRIVDMTPYEFQKYKEYRSKIRYKPRSTLAPEELAKVRGQCRTYSVTRKAKMSPEQREKERGYHRIGNMSPEQQKKRRLKDQTRSSESKMKHAEATRKRGVFQFDLTKAEYDAMFAAQGGLCAVCTRPHQGKKRMHVDHDHALGATKAAVRGLLCTSCNIRVVAVIESPLMAKALAYLANPPAPAILFPQAPPKPTIMGSVEAAIHRRWPDFDLISDDVYDGDRP